MRRLMTLAVLLCAPLAAMATETDRLIAGLATGNEAAMAEARQMLPRQPIEAVTKLIPLVDHEDLRIAFAATRTLEDFIGVVTRAGRDDDQRFVTRQIMTLLESGASDRARDTGFRLIPIVAPEDYDELAPVAMWLINPETREAARASLELTGTAAARNALRSALEDAEPAFQVSLLDALAQFDDPGNLAAASRLLDASEPEVRVAATRVLARAGGVEEVPAIRRVMNAVSGDHHREAAESYAVLAERIVLAGGNWDHGMAMFVELLDTSSDPVVKGMGIAGLGRFGDERAVPLILAALDGDGNGDGGEALERQVVSALQDLDGPAVRDQLLAAHDSLPPSMQVRLLDRYARTHDRRFLEHILAGARSEDREVQRVAMGALSVSPFPEVVDAIAAIAQTEDEDFSYEALRVLEKTAMAMESRGNAEAAGRAFLAVYQQTDMPVVRRNALAGMMRSPVPEAYEVLLSEIDGGDIAALPVDLLAGLTRAQFDEGRTQEAHETLDTLLARATAPHEVNAVIEVLHDAPIEGGLRRRLGLIAEWQIVGPFDFDRDDAFSVRNINEPEINLHARYTGKTGERIGWKRVTSPSGHGFINLVDEIGPYEYCSAYAHASVTIKTDTDGYIRVGSDDGIKVWVNGEEVLERNVDRGMALDQDSAPVSLRAGRNEILVQITQNAAGWGFVVRLVDEEGAPLRL